MSIDNASDVHRQAMVLGSVLNERSRQDEKWGEQNHSIADWVMILQEELGEFARAAMETRYRGADPARIREELVQVVAVALAMLECCDRNRWDTRS